MFMAILGLIVLSSVLAYIVQTNIWKLDLTKKKNSTLLETFE